MSISHTAEHIFTRSLSLLRPDIRVTKIVLSNDRNSVYFRCRSLDWNTILKAERMTNEVIERGLKVKEHYFDSLKDAKESFPDLRAMENRISGRVRVVEVDEYDYAACNKIHASNSSECEFFIVTNLSKSGIDLYEVEFEVGKKGKLKALEIAKTCMVLSEILGASLTTVEKRASNIVKEVEDLRRRVTSLSEKEVKNIPFIEESGVKIYSKIFEGLDRKRLMEKAGELIEHKGTIVALANLDDEAFIIFGRSPDIIFDSGDILRESLHRFGGKGGGKPEIAFGSVARDRAEELIEQIKKAVLSCL